MMICPSSLCQIEIIIYDIEQTLLFYERLLGWRFSPAEIHHCFIVDVPQDCPFGISLIYSEKKGAGTSNVLYFKVQALKFYQSKYFEVYGREADLKFRPGYGQVLLMEDPSGNCIGLFCENSVA